MGVFLSLGGVRACDPGSDSFLCEEPLRGLADYYTVGVKSKEVLLGSKEESLNKRYTGRCFVKPLNKAPVPALTQVFRIFLSIADNSSSSEAL